MIRVEHEDRIVGIDLGTTFSSVAVLEGDRPRILEGDRGERLVPSVVGLDAAGCVIVGQDARNQAVAFPERTIRSIKRRMGEDVRITLGDREYTPPEISALVLRRLGQIAAQRLGHAVHRAVITVPAYFSDAQRLATRQAGEIAGLEVVRIVNEPTAAGLAYGIQKDAARRILIFDFGGGTLDCSLLDIQDGVIEVRSSHGDTHLGGDDIDQALADLIAGRFEKAHGLDLRADRRSLARIVRAAERVKIHLSSNPFAKVQEEFIAQKDGAALHLVDEISRMDLEKLVEPLLDRAKVCVEKSLADAHVTREDLDRVLLVGGSSRIPMVRDVLQDMLGIEPTMHINPDECVALGAACEAALFAGHDVGAVLVDICAHSLGLGVVGVHDGTYDSDCFSVIIPRNSTIPTSRAEVYQTAVADQELARIRVYQGEHSAASANTLVGEFKFTQLSQGEAGQPIVIRFDYDLDGIVHVTATDKGSDRSHTVTMKDPRRAGAADTEASPPMPSLAPPPSVSGRQALLDKAREISATCADDALRTKMLELVERLESLEAQAKAATGDSASGTAFDQNLLVRAEEDLADLVYDAQS